jgi:hypothetical protein
MFNMLVPGERLGGEPGRLMAGAGHGSHVRGVASNDLDQAKVVVVVDSD